MKPGDLITLIRPVTSVLRRMVSNRRYPQLNQTYTCKKVTREGVLIEEFSFGMSIYGERHISIDHWRVVEPMDISEVIEESIKELQPLCA